MIHIPVMIAAALLLGAIKCSGREDDVEERDGQTGGPDGGRNPRLDGGISPDVRTSFKDSGGRTDTGSRLDAPSPVADAPRDIFVPPDAGADAATDGSLPPSLRPDVNIRPSLRLALFGGTFGSPEGTLYEMNLDPASAPVERGRIPSTDVVLRSHGSALFSIDRSFALIDIHDSAFGYLNTLDAGEGSNPQDIAVLPSGKAYVSRLDAQNDFFNDDDLLVFDLADDALPLVGSIDLTDSTFDDGERLARAGQMVFLEGAGELWVLLQDLGDPDNPFAINTNGKAAVINTETDAVTRTVELDGRNPADITYSEILDKVFVTHFGTYLPDFSGADTSTPYGGIETINPNTYESNGIVMDDVDLGGGPSSLRLASGELGYVITDARKIASFNPAEEGAGAVLSTEVYTSPGFYFDDFSVDTFGRLVIADPSAGVVVEGVAEPFVLEEPPSSLAFMPEE